jgi:hypothetical protein
MDQDEAVKGTGKGQGPSVPIAPVKDVTGAKPADVPLPPDGGQGLKKPIQ